MEIEEENSVFYPKYKEYEVIPLSSNKIIGNKKNSKSSICKNFLKLLFFILLILFFIIFFKYFLQNGSDIEFNQKFKQKTKTFFNINNSNNENNKTIGNKVIKNQIIGHLMLLFYILHYLGME